MRRRIVPFFGLMAVWFLVAVTGAVSLLAGYWFSDVMYDAGLWPIGALLRIGLFFELIGWGLAVIAIPLAALWALIFGADA